MTRDTTTDHGVVTDILNIFHDAVIDVIADEEEDKANGESDLFGYVDVSDSTAFDDWGDMTVTMDDGRQFRVTVRKQEAQP